MSLFKDFFSIFKESLAMKWVLIAAIAIPFILVRACSSILTKKKEPAPMKIEHIQKQKSGLGNIAPHSFK